MLHRPQRKRALAVRAFSFSFSECHQPSATALPGLVSEPLKNDACPRNPRGTGLPSSSSSSTRFPTMPNRSGAKRPRLLPCYGHSAYSGIRHCVAKGVATLFSLRRYFTAWWPVIERGAQDFQFRMLMMYRGFHVAMSHRSHDSGKTSGSH